MFYAKMEMPSLNGKIVKVEGNTPIDLFDNLVESKHIYIEEADVYPEACLKKANLTLEDIDDEYECVRDWYDDIGYKEYELTDIEIFDLILTETQHEYNTKLFRINPMGEDYIYDEYDKTY